MNESGLLKKQGMRQDQVTTLEIAETPALNVQAIADMNDSRKKSGLSLSYKDQPIVLDQARPIGLYANELCQLIPVKINGIQFPALAMRRFQDLPFEVRDSKNHRSSTGETNILAGPCSEAELLQAFDIVLDELVILLKNNVKINKDSFNLAVVDGQAHLYFNDLGTAKFETIEGKVLEKYIEAYLDFAIVAFLSGITEPIVDKATGEEPDYDSLKQKLRNNLLAKLS